MPTIEAEWNDGLHRALAERARADHGRAAMILERTRHDFGGRSRAGGLGGGGLGGFGGSMGATRSRLWPPRRRRET